MNAELLRNLWLELTPVRRWSTPPVLLLLVLFVELVDERPGPWSPNWGGHMALGLTLYTLFAVWGGWKATNSVVSEVLANTWDLQRLGQHRPWELLWGKIVGSSFYEALLAYLGIALTVAGGLGVGKLDPTKALSLGATMLLGLWLLLALATMMSLVSARHLSGTRRPSRPSMVLGMGLFVLLNLGYQLASLLDSDHSAHQALIPWWIPLPLHTFVPLSLALYLGWAWALGHRLMRAELQEAVGPLSWLSFQAFVVLYLFPLWPKELATGVGGPFNLLMISALGVFGLLLYPFLLVERKDWVLWRSLREELSRGHAWGLWTRLPMWCWSLLILGLGLAALTGGVLASPGQAGPALWVVAGSTFLFMLRDAAWIVAVHLSPTMSRSPEWTVLFFLGLFYGLFPALTGLLSPSLLFLLVPFMDLGKGLPPGALGLAHLFILAWALPGLGLALIFATRRGAEVLR